MGKSCEGLSNPWACPPLLAVFFQACHTEGSQFFGLFIFVLVFIAASTGADPTLPAFLLPVAASCPSRLDCLAPPSCSHSLFGRAPRGAVLEQGAGRRGSGFFFPSLQLEMVSSRKPRALENHAGPPALRLS